MSLPITKILACPQCGKESEILLWQSVNVSIDGRLKKKLLHGELNKFSCRHCGKTCGVEHDLLYHDMEKEFMVHLKFLNSKGEILMDSMPLDISAKVTGNYRLRFVTSWSHLIEKIMIFDEGMDDRAIELVKFGLWVKHAPNDFSEINQFVFHRRRRKFPFGKLELIFLKLEEKHECLFPVPEDAYLSAMEVVANFPLERDWLLVNHEYLRALHPELNSVITAAKWENKLCDCDFQLARDEIADFLKMQDDEARQKGGEYIWNTEVAEAIRIFLARPNLQTAAKLLEHTPAFYAYFEECKPTGRFAFFKRNFQGGR